MLNRKRTLFIVTPIAVALVGVMGFSYFKSEAQEPLAQTLVSQDISQTNTTNQETVVAVSEPIKTIDLVTIRNPLDPTDKDLTRLTTFNDGKYNDIASITQYSVSGTILELKNDFRHIGTGKVMLSPDKIGSFMIIHEFTFENDATIVWDSATTSDDSIKWSAHPETIDVQAGRKAFVAYTTTDGGYTWLATVRAGEI